MTDVHLPPLSDFPNLRSVCLDETEMCDNCVYDLVAQAAICPALVDFWVKQPTSKTPDEIAVVVQVTGTYWGEPHEDPLVQCSWRLIQDWGFQDWDSLRGRAHLVARVSAALHNTYWDVLASCVAHYWDV